MSMSEEVSHSKSFRKEKDVEAKGLRMGSFGGMGGMGGFGEMGEYDGMRGRGMEFGRRFSWFGLFLLINLIEKDLACTYKEKYQFIVFVAVVTVLKSIIITFSANFS